MIQFSPLYFPSNERKTTDISLQVGKFFLLSLPLSSHMRTEGAFAPVTPRHNRSGCPVTTGSDLLEKGCITEASRPDEFIPAVRRRARIRNLERDQHDDHVWVRELLQKRSGCAS